MAARDNFWGEMESVSASHVLPALSLYDDPPTLIRNGTVRVVPVVTGGDGFVGGVGVVVAAAVVKVLSLDDDVSLSLFVDTTR